MTYTQFRQIFLYCFILQSVTCNIKVRECEPLSINMCSSIGYNQTSMPNLVGHTNQAEAKFLLATFNPLIKYGCSPHLKFFLCSAYAPMCTVKLLDTLGPCRPMCEQVRQKCEPVLNKFGFPWPQALNCSRFVEHIDQKSLCMMPAGFEQSITTTAQPPIEQSISKNSNIHNIVLKDCSHLKNGDNGYVLQNGTDSVTCALLCDKDDLFSSQDKQFAKYFVAVFSISCLVLTAFTVLTFLIDAEKFRHNERPVVLMAFCYLCCSCAYIISLSVGRKSTICQPVTQTQTYVLIDDGLANTSCTIVFLLLYYFGTAAHLWWVVLALECALSLGTLHEQQGAIRRNSCFHLFVWGFSALCTILILFLRLVDPDELTGTCYIGNRNSNALILFVITPLCIYVLLGTTFFIAGFVLCYKRNNSHLKPKTVKSRQVDLILIKISIFSMVFVLTNSCVVGCFIYEYLNRTKWLSADFKTLPNIEIFMLKIVCSLFDGILTGLWSWNSRTLTSWRNFFRRLLGFQRNLDKSTLSGSIHTQRESVPYDQNSILFKQSSASSTCCRDSCRRCNAHAHMEYGMPSSRCYALHNTTATPLLQD